MPQNDASQDGCRYEECHEPDEPEPREAQAQRELEKQRAYEARSELRRKVELARERQGGKGLEKRAFEESGKGKMRERSPIAYMIKLEGRKGTRGAVDYADMESARRLDEEDRTAVYFRLGDEMWISHDPDVLEEVQRALEPEDRIDRKMRVSEGRNQAMEYERLKLETQRAEVEVRKGEFEAKRRALEERLQGLHENDQPPDELLEEKAAIDDEMESLWRPEEELRRAHGQLARKMKIAYEGDKYPRAEMRRVHNRVLEEIARIARRAIEEGRAERFEP